MSNLNFPCYQNIIGLYDGSCNCYTAAPADYNDSDSGLYISDLLEPKFIDGLLNCDQGNSIWDLMEIVRDLATRYFIAESNALLMKQNKLRRAPYYGGIGMSTSTKDLTITDGYYAGVRMISPLIRSGYLKIKKIGLLLNTTQALTLTIYDRTGTALHTLNLSATANVHTINTLATAITLPLYDAYLDYMEYYFVYQVSGFEPKNNSIFSCSSCNKYHPGWMDFGYHSKMPWHAWLNVGGFTSDGLPDFDSTAQGTEHLNGLTFDVEIGCLVNEVFCKDALDYEGNTLAQAMAIAIQKLSGALFVDKILTSQNLNRSIMIDREQLAKSAEGWRATYAEMIEYIVSNIDIEANDCFECRDMIEMIKVGIFA
jgi:hypothetical protein